jgi:hypothetical protein
MTLAATSVPACKLPAIPPPPARCSLADAQRLIALVDDDEADVRQRAAEMVNNFNGDQFPLIQRALAAPNLSPEAQGRLEAATPLVRARWERLQRAKPAGNWLEKAFLAGYEQAGRTDSRWNEPVREALRQYVQCTITGWDEWIDQRAALKRATDKAVDAGCDDAILVYLADLCALDVPGRPAQLQQLRKDVQKIADSAYPVDCRGWLVLDYASWSKTTEPTLLSRVKQWLPDILDRQAHKPDPMTSSIAYSYVMRMNNVLMPNSNPETAFGFIQPIYEKAWPNDPGPLCYFAFAEIYRADIYRDVRIPLSGAPDSEEQFAQHMTKAVQALEKAWTMRKDDPLTAELMFEAKAGLAQDLPEIRTWYQRAKAAQPDNHGICRRMSDCLFNSGEGAEAMLAFGRECLEAGNWRAGDPFDLVMAHNWLAKRTGNATGYWRDEPQAWRDVNSVYATYLRLYPDDKGARSLYARIACDCGQWQTADEQFKLIGDMPNLDSYHGLPDFLLKRYAAARRSGTKLPPELFTATDGVQYRTRTVDDKDTVDITYPQKPPGRGQQPHLEADGDGRDIAIFLGDGDNRFFHFVKGAYTAKQDMEDKLVHEGKLFILTRPDGGRLAFNDFTVAPALRGKLATIGNDAGRSAAATQGSE